jgi:hypothetical protein
LPCCVGQASACQRLTSADGITGARSWAICCLVGGLVVGLRIVVGRGYLQTSKTDRLKPVLLFMRIKIIGNNNCARATRHLLRLAGFAVTEFLPVEAVTQAPHSGYAITIELARDASSGSVADAALGDTSTASTAAAFPGCAVAASASDSAAFASVGHASEASASGVSVGGGSIHFDCVESELERFVLRHVTQLAAAPVVVDRPGGVVHSERELRIVVPLAIGADGSACMDEAAAVAVEFGVLRGLLDLAAFPPSPSAMADLSAFAPSSASPRSAFASLASASLGFASARSACASLRSAITSWRAARGGKRGWWKLWGFILAAALLAPAAIIHASGPAIGRLALLPRGKSILLSDRRSVVRAGLFVRQVGNDSHILNRDSAELNPSRSAFTTGLRGAVRSKMMLRVTNGAYLRVAAGGFAAEPAQGQFSIGQQTKITDGTNTLVVDPCKGQTKVFVSINQTANTQLAAGTASKKIYVCSIHVVVAAATNVALVEGTGSVCATGTAGVSGFGGATAATGWNFAANGGIVVGNGDSSVGAEGTSADNLCLYNSSAGQVSGGVSYVVQ